MRSFFVVGLLFLTVSLHASDFQFVRVWPSYRSIESFEHVSEFFTGREDTEGQTLLRTHSNDRPGYYFLARYKNAGPDQDAQAELQVILPTSPKTVTYLFNIRLTKGNHVLNVGITGKDWPTPTIVPVAWRFRLLTLSGEELVKQQSFAWGLPEK